VSGWSPSDLLPGLCFLVFAAGLAAALRRWYDPLPRRFLAVFLLLVSILFASSLFGGWILLPLGNLTGAVPYRHLPPPPIGNWLQGDLIHQITPWLLEVRRAVFDGRWPLWNARGGAGMPLMGDPQSEAFQPLVVAGYLLPVCQAAAVTSALRVFVALAFSFLFLRRQRLGEPAALCGALAYGLGGFLLLWLGWPIGNGAALLPALLYAVARVDDEGRRRDSVLLFLVTAAVLLGGHPETQLYELSCAGIFLLARIAARPAWRERRALLVRSGLAMGLAAAAMAPVLLPVASYLPETHRATLIRYHLAPRPLGTMLAVLSTPEAWAAWQKEAVQRVLPVAAPRSFGDLEEYWGSENFIEDTSGCAGAAALFAALLALLPLRIGAGAGGARFPQERLAIGILLVSLALLAQPPGFDSLFFRLPVIGATAIHHHHRMLLLVNLAVAWLAACTVERWGRGELRRSAVVAVAAAAAGLIAWAYISHPSPETGRVVYGLAEGGLAAQLLAVALTLGLFLVRPGRTKRAPRWLPWALAGVIAAELFGLHGAVNSATPREFAYPTTPSIAFLQRSLGPYRMMGLGQAFLPNIPLFYGLRDVRIDNPSLPTIYAGLTAPLSRNPMVPRFGRPVHPLYDLLAVRYIAARAGVVLPLPLVYRDAEVWIYERPGALPLLFLPARARIQRDDTRWWTWVQENSDFAARALVAPSPERWQPWRSRPGVGSTVTLTSFGPALLRAHASLGEPRLLASSIYQEGGWLLLDGGVLAPTTFANGPFLGAWLAQGEHDLQLLYRPRQLVAGCVLAALALAAAAALWVPRPRCYPGSDGLPGSDEDTPRPG
jgi:hypothetical protein